jgi:uncharacterized protein
VFTVGSIRGMAWFTVTTTYSTDRDKLAEVRPKHRDYLRALAGDGVVVAAGPFTDDLGGFFIAEVEDRAQLDRLLADDPYTTDGVVAQQEVREWKAVLGSWLPAQ